MQKTKKNVNLVEYKYHKVNMSNKTGLGVYNIKIRVIKEKC